MARGYREHPLSDSRDQPIDPRMIRTLAFALAVGAGVLIAFPASGQEQSKCAPTESVARQLAEKYGEVPVWAGLDEGGSMIAMVYQSKGGTWTEVLARPDGISCLVGSGTRARRLIVQDDPS